MENGKMCIRDSLSRVTNDVETVSNALQQSFIQIVTGILTLALAITMMFTIQPLMACISILIIPISLLITRGVVSRSQKQFKAQQDSMGALNGTITELYGGYNEILLFGRQEDSIWQFEEVNDELQKHAFKAQFVSSLMNPLISLTTYLCIGSIAVLGCFQVISGTITVGNLQAFIRYIWPVSYTHLDVYKRQRERRAFRAAGYSFKYDEGRLLMRHIGKI